MNTYSFEVLNTYSKRRQQYAKIRWNRAKRKRPKNGKKKRKMQVNKFANKIKGGKIMPRYDETGPLGQGQLSGRGFGPCGRGFGFGRGFGRGFGWRQQNAGFGFPELSKEEQKKILKAELEQIALEKKALENKLKEMK